MTDLWLFDYVDGTLVQTLHQVSTDADFPDASPLWPMVSIGFILW